MFDIVTSRVSKPANNSFKPKFKPKVTRKAPGVSVKSIQSTVTVTQSADGEETTKQKEIPQEIHLKIIEGKNLNGEKDEVFHEVEVDKSLTGYENDDNGQIKSAGSDVEPLPKENEKDISVSDVTKPIPSSKGKSIFAPTFISKPTALAATTISVPKSVAPSISAVGNAIKIPTSISNFPTRNQETVEKQHHVVGKSFEESSEKESMPVVLDLATATMSQLIRHPFTQGKLSSREEARMQEKILKKFQKKNASDIAIEMQNDETSTKPSQHSNSNQPSQRSIPKLILVNGELVVDRQSLQINTALSMEENSGVVIDEDAVNRYVTSASFRGRTKTVSPKWSAAMTERFYMGLSYFGTDFKSISYMFPGLTHRHIKLKNKSEEVHNSAKITQYLRNRQKAPVELRKRILASVAGKQKLENSYYIGRVKEEETSEQPAAQDVIKDEKNDQVVTSDVKPKITDDESATSIIEPNLQLNLNPLPESIVSKAEIASIIETSSAKRGPIDTMAVKTTSKRRKKTNVTFD